MPLTSSSVLQVYKLNKLHLLGGVAACLNLLGPYTPDFKHYVVVESADIPLDSAALPCRMIRNGENRSACHLQLSQPGLTEKF